MKTKIGHDTYKIIRYLPRHDCTNSVKTEENLVTFLSGSTELTDPSNQESSEEAPHPYAGNPKPIITQISLSGAKI